MDWWATALIALGASLAGALTGGLISVLVAARRRLRAARAEILTTHLPRLADLVTEAEQEVRFTHEPRPAGPGVLDAFETLDRYAAASSGADRDRVHEPVLARLATIDTLAGEYGDTHEQPNQERAPVARDLAKRQLPVWHALTLHLAAYQNWLIANLGRWW